MVCDCTVTWADWATLATSAGTVVLAVVAWYQARQAKSQIEQTRSQIQQTDSQIELGKGQLEIGRGQLEAAQEASRAAADVHRESIRTRADQFAPRISVHYGAVSGPYYSSTR